MRARSSRYSFSPGEHEAELLGIFSALEALDEVDDRALARILKRFPKNGRGLFSKSELVRAARFFGERAGSAALDRNLIAKLRTKPVRTQSGVAPVTVLTKPFPCPGQCVFCPSDVRMPKSYLSKEPGAQRAAQHRFDPYAQTWGRLAALHANGHPVDKVELIVLGGTWSSYPEPYQIWFIERCLDALNAFDGTRSLPLPEGRGLDYGRIDVELRGEDVGVGVGVGVDASRRTYNGVVNRLVRELSEGLSLSSEGLSRSDGPSGSSRASHDTESSDWDSLARKQALNEEAGSRCVGLSLETRPDAILEREVFRLRRLGATKIQLGVQSLSDEVLALNRRGHDVSTTRRAVELLRRAGFKIQVHWMPNLLGSTPEKDVEDFEGLFEDPALRPDELKIYPCSLVESAELMRFYRDGSWRPYTEDELVELLTRCLQIVPGYCRLTRVIRDIPGHDIVAGNRLSNMRERAEDDIVRRGGELRDVRSREIRGAECRAEALRLEVLDYDTSTGSERFLQLVTEEGRLAAFLRLSLPASEGFLHEVRRSAFVREVHVYGATMSLHARDPSAAQHRGLGKRLLAEAARIAGLEGFEELSVISAMGTRAYYRTAGFSDGSLYQHQRLVTQPPLS